MMANPCEHSRWLHGTREPGALPPLHDLARLLARSLPELEDEPSATGRHHDEPTARVGGIRLRMTWRTERHQAVEIEVRAPLGALDDVVDLEGAPAATRLAPPAGAPEDHPADLRPLPQGGRRAPRGARAAPLDPATRGGTNAHIRPKRSPQHRRRQPFCPLGQNLFLRIAVRVRFGRLPMWANGLVECERVPGPSGRWVR